LKERNKPVRPPKTPEAPFFLRTLPGLEPKFIPSEDTTKEIKEVPSRILNFSAIRPKTPFIKTLEEAENGASDGCMYQLSHCSFLIMSHSKLFHFVLEISEMSSLMIKF
jgi:U3 small nucleolar RNA-associated protein 21